ncbi:16962_t:CDS:1, partial [Racocetra persica]
ENYISNVINDIRSLLNVDLCFVLDCTDSMSEHIAAAKNCILRVSNYVKNYGADIKLRFGFCGYRDYCDRHDHIQILNFTNSHEEFRSYITNKVNVKGGRDIPEDVLGGLNAAITRMSWNSATRVLIHIGDAPPHGRRFTNKNDEFPDGDPNGLTAEKVLKTMKSNNILYHFGKINNSTEIMLGIFREIIGDFPVFDLKTTSNNPDVLLNRFVDTTCSAIISSVLLTTTLRNPASIHSLQLKRLQINPLEPDWSTLPEKPGELLYYPLPKSLDEIKDDHFFINSKFTTRNISFKLAPQPFSVGAERYAYFALCNNLGQGEKFVIKEYHNSEQDSEKRCLELIEVSNIAKFLSTEFNLAIEQTTFKWKVNFLDVNILSNKSNTSTLYYSIEKYFSDAKFKRFNTNSGIITDFHSALEAFAHFTYQYTKGYLVVYDLQGVSLNKEFLLTDPAIHCIDILRFGETNFGKKGIEKFFLKKHECNMICEGLNLDK